MPGRLVATVSRSTIGWRNSLIKQCSILHWSSTQSTVLLVRFLVFEVLKRLKHHFQFLVAGKSTASELHAANILAKSRMWRMMRSNATCLICLTSAPNSSLSCGHSLCDNCVSTFGTFCDGDEYGYNLEKCFLCDSECKLRTRSTPPTCGVRVASFDGGGTRGVIPIEDFRLLQNLLGEDCFIPSFFDIAVGTSSGFEYFTYKLVPFADHL